MPELRFKPRSDDFLGLCFSHSLQNSLSLRTFLTWEAQTVPAGSSEEFRDSGARLDQE